jgi:hypothetical protein
MSIELISRISTPTPVMSEPLPVKRITFESRNACFQFETSQHDWFEHAVHFYVGPIGLHVTPDEAEATGKAMIECAEHFRAALARVGGEA